MQFLERSHNKSLIQLDIEYLVISISKTCGSHAKQGLPTIGRNAMPVEI